jgi:hypothetical protein
MSDRDTFGPGGPDTPWRPLSGRSIADIRAEAAQYRRMAETASTREVMTGLRRLADRLEGMADQRENEGRC